jgi:hypothetical protein
MKGINVKGLSSVLSALAISAATTLSAQVTSAPAGPFVAEGTMSVDNTPKGGVLNDFTCEVRLYGVAGEDGTGQIFSMHSWFGGDGMVPGVCPGIYADVDGETNPWTYVINVSSGVIEIEGVSFRIAQQPGCGTDSPDGGTLVAEWTNGVSTPSPIPALGGLWSRILATNAPIDEGMPLQQCVVKDLDLKFYMLPVGHEVSASP